MKTTSFVVAVALCAWNLLTGTASAAENYSGNWTVMPAETAGHVEFGLVYRRPHHHSQHSSDWPLTAFQGVDFAERGKRDVQFTVTRAAGRFDCEGYLNNGVGAGVFLFTPDPGYIKAMASLGFPVNEDLQFTMAIVDVSAEFAREMQAQKLAHLDTDKLLALRIHGASAKYIQELRAEGLPLTDSDQVVAFRVHGVSVAQVRELRKLDIDVDEDRLIAFRVHGVTPDFVHEVEKLGYPRPDPDQLVAMRVHGVTPAYIDKMKSRGVKDLSIEKLIALRVHGIN